MKRVLAPALIAGGTLLILLGYFKPSLFWESGKFQRWMAESGSVAMGRYFMILGAIPIAVAIGLLVWPAQDD